MPSNKDRLYIALYVRGGPPKMPGLEDTYHWALVVGPKAATGNRSGVRYHVRERLGLVGEPPVLQPRWELEVLDISMQRTSMLLVRVVIGKVADAGRVRAIFESTPLRPEDREWNCVAWVKEAFEAALRHGKALGTAAVLWQSVRDETMRYVGAKKAAHRFDTPGNYDADNAPTWDMLQGVELVP